jgi:hypothetical protein
MTGPLWLADLVCDIGIANRTSVSLGPEARRLVLPASTTMSYSR